MSKKIILNNDQLNLSLDRLACQLTENHDDFKDTVLVGLQPRGKSLCENIVKILLSKYKINTVDHGFLDITFFRDDFRRSEKVLEPNINEMEFIVEEKRVVLIDDVLHTGRTIRAALTAIQSYGRPKNIELLILIDRRFSRHLPIQPDYRGRQVDAFENEKIIVNWKETKEEDNVYLIK